MPDGTRMLALTPKLAYGTVVSAQSHDFGQRLRFGSAKQQLRLHHLLGHQSFYHRASDHQSGQPGLDTFGNQSPRGRHELLQRSQVDELSQTLLPRQLAIILYSHHGTGSSSKIFWMAVS